MIALTADELTAIALSLKVAFWSVAVSLPFSLALAYLLARARFPGKTALDAIIHLPLVLPPVVIGFALLLLFGRNGPIGAVLERWFGIVVAFRWTGAALAAAIMGFPLMVRAMRLSIAAIDRRLEVAARTLGASRIRIGATITFVSSIPGETQTLPLAIYGATQVPGGDAQALRLSLVAVVLSVVALAASEWMTRRARHEPGYWG